MTGCRPIRERTRSPSVTHVSILSIPAPSTLRATVQGFTIQGRLAHSSRRNAFIIFRARVWLGPFTASLTVTAVFAYRRYYTCTAPPDGTLTRWKRALQGAPVVATQRAGTRQEVIAAAIPLGNGVGVLEGGGPLLASPLGSFLAWRGSYGGNGTVWWEAGSGSKVMHLRLHASQRGP